MISAPAFADTLVWSCSHNGNPNALDIYSLPSGTEATTVAIITDQQLANTLQLPMNYRMEGESSSLNGNFSVLLGEYESGFDFTQVNGGVKIQAVYSMGPVSPDRNWYFNPGECVKH